MDDPAMTVVSDFWDARWTDAEQDEAVARAAEAEREAHRDLQRALTGLQAAMDGMRAACEWHAVTISLRAASRRKGSRP